MNISRSLIITIVLTTVIGMVVKIGAMDVGQEDLRDVPMNDEWREMLGYDLIEAINEGNMSAAIVALDAGADINTKSVVAGMTPLHLAVSKRSPEEMVHLLLKKNADVNVQDRDGLTPLYWAVCGRLLSITKLLILAGANPHIKNNKGRTVCDAASSEMLQVIKHTITERRWREVIHNGIRQGSGIGFHRTIPDLSIMVSLAVGEDCGLMVNWLLKLDPEAHVHGGMCSICRESFAGRVLNDDVALCRTTRACSHLMCDKCAWLQRRTRVTLDTDRNRGIYLGQNAAGIDQWMLPGRIDFSRCPECRAEQEEMVFVPSDHHRKQFEELKREFYRLYPMLVSMPHASHESVSV